MGWFRIDDTFHSHPKVRRAGATSVGIWALAGSYCVAYKSRGFIPTWWLQGWGRTGTTAARKLVEAGLWDEAEQDGEPGYQFHDWDDYQQLPEQIERSRDVWRTKKARQRERSSRHASGDHSMCHPQYCAALKKKGTKGDMSPVDNQGDMQGDSTGESPLSLHDTTRQYLPKGRYRSGVSDSGTGPEGADPSPPPHPTYSRDQINNAPAEWQRTNLWPYDPANPQYGGWQDDHWRECITVPPAYRKPRRGEPA